jgi:hypothetical protein
MKKKLLLISSVLLTLSLVTIVFFNSMGNKENNIISNIEKDEPIINSNMITMMYETEAGSGEYTETSDNTWPETGYIFNENLSGCENGGELEYNSINNTVNLLSNSSDACYVYFDKYDGVWIDNVVATNITGSSVTLDVTATSENGSISNYYYSLNDSEYISINTNPIVIDNLNKLTEYKISIYAVDSTNAKSNIYDLSVSTTDESKPIINSVEVTNLTVNSFTINVTVSNPNNIVRYYFIMEDGFTEVSTDSSFSMTGLRYNTEYTIGIFLEDDKDNLSKKYYFTVRTDNLSYLTDYIISKYEVNNEGSNDMYYHDGNGNYLNVSYEAGDNSYRYSGSNPSNFICFGTSVTPCSDDNLYRIIGVFNGEIKIIKYKDIGYYPWKENDQNIWSASDIRTTLNNTFYNNFETDWKNMIVYHNWSVGGGTHNQLRYSDAKTAYDYEVGDKFAGVLDNIKIGLLYVSDYYYAANPNFWSYPGSSFDGANYDYRAATNDNWIFEGKYEWTISRIADNDNQPFGIGVNGDVDLSITSAIRIIRPCFYLATNLELLSGDGTINNPFIIKT